MKAEITCRGSRAVADAFRSLGPERASEWLTRAKPHELPMCAPLAERARMLLLPAIAGAFHVGFSTLSELPSCVDLSFVEDVHSDPDAHGYVREAAAQALAHVRSIEVAASARGFRSFDRYRAYQEAMFLEVTSLRALARLGDESASSVGDMSIDIFALRSAEYRRPDFSGSRPEGFPILIWAGAAQAMNRAAGSVRSARRRG